MGSVDRELITERKRALRFDTKGAFKHAEECLQELSKKLAGDCQAYDTAGVKSDATKLKLTVKTLLLNHDDERLWTTVPILAGKLLDVVALKNGQEHGTQVTDFVIAHAILLYIKSILVSQYKIYELFKVLQEFNSLKS